MMRQILFVGGKCFTYMFLGALAASVGVILLKNTRFAEAAPALRIAAGAITVVFGLAMIGLRLPFYHENTKGRNHEGEGKGPWIGFLSGLLVRPGHGAAFVLGLGVGFLPCPLPIGMLAAAAGMHSVPQGIAIMAGVGLGTAPGLLGVGLFGMGLDRKLKRAGMRAAGVIVILIGALTLFRASGTMAHNPPQSPLRKGGSHVWVLPPCCQEQRTK